MKKIKFHVDWFDKLNKKGKIFLCILFFILIVSVAANYKEINTKLISGNTVNKQIPQVPSQMNSNTNQKQVSGGSTPSSTSPIASQSNSPQSSVSIPPVNYANLEKMLSANDLIKDMPSDGIFLLKFYNFNTGQRQWEKSYVIKKNSLKEGSEAADVTLSLHSKYVNELNSQNFCDVVKKAKANGDLGFDTTLSKAKLLWKYKGMMKYKDCFGF